MDKYGKNPFEWLRVWWKGFGRGEYTEEQVEEWLMDRWKGHAIGEYTEEQVEWLTKRWVGHEKELQALIPVIKKNEEWYDSKEYKALMDALESLPEGLKPVERDLRGVYLRVADLSGAYLRDVDLSGATLFRANLSKANLGNACLSNANLGRANLSKAYLGGANLSGGNLTEANLSGADLWCADLSCATLVFTNLNNTKLGRANLSKAHYELQPGFLPNIATIATAKNITSVIFLSPHSLFELREAFKKAGLRSKEREITSTLEHSKRLRAWNLGGISGKIESIFKCIFFELTCKYGLSPSRPLLIMLFLILILAFPYKFALTTHGQEYGIWKVWHKDAIGIEQVKKEKPGRVTATGSRAWRIGFYFSVLSAFHIGWKDLNVGNWIARIQPDDYTLRATGWVRTISGIQALISVYMLALWVLSYFGRPFG